MKLAVWNHPPADFFLSGFTTGAVECPFTIERGRPADCEAWLREGRADVALVPTVSVLRDPKAFRLAPAVALSAWEYPYARLVLKHGLRQPVKRVAFDPHFVQEVLLARIVLKEHYGAAPTFVPREQSSVEALLEGPEDAALLVGPELGLFRHEGLVLDLGQEWYEMVNYPMVWGLFAGRPDELPPEAVRALRASARAADATRSVWVRALDTAPSLHAFFSEGLRLWLDDLAVASLTELKQQLFFYKILDEIPDLDFVSVDEEDE